MCISNAVSFTSNKPIIAYKVMRTTPHKSTLVICNSAGNDYEIGKQYEAGDPALPFEIRFTDVYDKGFHAYQYLDDAAKEMLSCKKLTDATLAVVEVELSELTFKGFEVHNAFPLWESLNDIMPTYVANKCKFIKILEQPCA